MNKEDKLIEKQEVKKVLYKEKPLAIRTKHDKGYLYTATTSIGVHNFFVPYSEMGSTPFDKEMPSQLLIRWMK